MRKKLAVHSVAVAVIIVCLAGAGRSDTPENPGPEEAVFEMREVSAFDEFVANPGIHLTRGTYAECSTVPDKDVKAYPKLNSKQPLYGKVVFDPSLWRGKSPLVFHFVLDESGDTATKEEQTAEKKPETSLLDRLAEKLSVLADEGAQWKKSPKKKAKRAPFDRLYVDLNRDLDLSNDPVLKPTADPPWHALPDWDINERVAYDCLNIDVDFGPRTGERPFRILPWFSSSEQGGRTYNMMHFVAVTARRGMVRVGKYEFDVLMAQPYVVTGRFDRTTTTLHWTPKNPEEKPSFQASLPENIGTMWPCEGELYTIAATPTGDHVIVKPYRGEFGILKIGPGGRDIKDCSLRGSLTTDSCGIAVGPDPSVSEDKQEKIEECKVPVGDYLPTYLTIEFGQLRLRVSDSYHSDGKPRDEERRRTYGMKIRKDAPFVLDFANKPDVVFASPAKDRIARPGDEVEVKAVLVDPVLDIMIRGLDDTRRTKKETVKPANGQEYRYERPLSLDPKVTISDSAGKTVAEGVMPFG